MNTADILQSPSVVAVIAAVVTGVFVQRRLVVMSNLARSVVTDGMKQGNVRTKFNAITGSFEAETTDSKTTDPELAESKEKPLPKRLRRRKPVCTIEKGSGKSDVPTRVHARRID